MVEGAALSATTSEAAPDPDDLLAVARHLAAIGAGHIAAAHYGETSGARATVATKTSLTDLVTATDHAAEAAIVAAIEALRPGDGIVGEEGAAHDTTTGVTWVIDPIDGTTNFAYGHLFCCTSVAARVEGQIVAAAVDAPLFGEVFAAERGRGATLTDRAGTRRLHLAPPDPTLPTALVGTGFSYEAARRARQGAVVAQLLPRVRDIRRGGSAALDLCWVGAGRLDAFYERGLQQWDHAGGALIAHEAGATVSTLDGGPLRFEATILAARPTIHDELADFLRDAGAVDA